MVASVAMGVIALPFWKALAPCQQSRLITFLNPEVDPRKTGWHIIQSKVAIGSGGFLGKGFTHGPQNRPAFLPPHHTGFIFPGVGGELRVLGALLPLALVPAPLLLPLRVPRR